MFPREITQFQETFLTRPPNSETWARHHKSNSTRLSCRDRTQEINASFDSFPVDFADWKLR